MAQRLVLTSLSFWVDGHLNSKDLYADFLAQQCPKQAGLVAHYALDIAGQMQQVWLKKAGQRHGMGRYRIMAAIAWLTRMPALKPVPNLGGQAAISTEVQRLQSLGAAGVRVPQVLASGADGFLMSHLGVSGQHTPSLAEELENATQAGQLERGLALWQEGLDFLASVHARGQCLSQAFARNIVRCADGVLGAVDFEDDPSAALPLPLCQLRDVLAYAHSTALYLQDAGALPQAQQAWQNWLAAPANSPALQAAVQQTLARMAWLRHLPADRSWGRDAQRLRAAYVLLQKPI
jgi:hypothetical protein